MEYKHKPRPNISMVIFYPSQFSVQQAGIHDLNKSILPVDEMRLRSGSIARISYAVLEDVCRTEEDCLHTSLFSKAKRVAAVREVTPSLLKIDFIWLLVVCMLITSCPAIWALVRPCATRRSTSTSRSVSSFG